MVAGQFTPEHPRELPGQFLQRTSVAALAVFPYLLYRFTTAFGSASRRLALAVGAMTTTVVVWAYALPSYPEQGEPWTTSFALFVTAFLVNWTVLSAVAAWRLWRAGHGQPGVARRRMRLFGYGAVAITVAIFLIAASSDPDSSAALAGELAALLGAVAFLLGLRPPAILRMAWRRPEQERVQSAVESLILLARSEREVVERVLPAMADIVGARGIALLDHDGTLLGAHNVEGQYDARRKPDRGQVVEVATPTGAVVAWTSPYAPYFGDEELQLLRTLGVLTGMAVDRVRLFAAEHETRLALERVNESREHFIALAAHELRTPVAGIYGFVKTLNRLEDRLSPETEQELREALEAQSEHLASLVEQLLDLSRLDADAIEIRPEQFAIRERLERIAVAAAGREQHGIEIHVSPGLEGTADTEAFDRIVSNLLTNAVRYGEPPILVSAHQSDRHLRVTVEDRGRGVPQEFVPSLFDRFARGETARAVRMGTGLGLAIAKSYARAHSGDLYYEQAEPSGARFRLVLPSRPDAEAVAR